MKKTKLIATILILLLLAPIVKSQEQTQVDKVIIASESNYPDALVSSSVSQKLGIPVLLTDENKLSDETLNSLKEISPDQIIVVGGPEVIDSSVIQKLRDEGYQTNRLWGMSRYGTANEIISHFWTEGVKKAVLVENKFGERTGNVLGLSKNLANGHPMIPIPDGEIPAETMALLNDLGVEEVTFVGSELSESMESDLDSIGVQIRERIQAKNESQLQEKIRQRIRERISNESLIFVAVGGFHNVISAPNLPQSKSYLISNESQITEALETINERNITKIKVVGEPDLANIISETLKNETDAEIQLISSRGKKASQIAANLTQQNMNQFSNMFQRNHGNWTQQLEQNQERLQNQANITLNHINDLISDYNATQLNESLNQAQELYNEGKYLEAKIRAKQIQNEIMKNQWQNAKGNTTRLRNLVQEETKTLEQKTNNLTQLNKEFGDYMKQNMTVQQRLEVIQTFKNRRMNQVRSIVENATQMGLNNMQRHGIRNTLREIGRGHGPFGNQTENPRKQNQGANNTPGNQTGNQPINEQENPENKGKRNSNEIKQRNE